MATAGVLLFKGPQARQCTQKAEHTKGGLWPPQGSCYLRGHRQGGTHTKRSVATAGVMLFEGGAGAGPRVERSEPKVGGGDYVHTIGWHSEVVSISMPWQREIYNFLAGVPNFGFFSCTKKIVQHTFK